MKLEAPVASVAYMSGLMMGEFFLGGGVVEQAVDDKSTGNSFTSCEQNLKISCRDAIKQIAW
jgi:hypothetical protein